MKVFIGWSGQLSRQVAEGLRDWLPNVLQTLEPWMSNVDMEKGVRWSADVAKNLEEARVGVLCITSDNLNSKWIHFEAGALSKVVGESLVCPYLHGLSPSSLKGPLSQFQAARADVADTKKLLTTMNNALGEAKLQTERLDRSFERWWPEFERNISRMVEAEPEERGTVTPERNERELIEELLVLVRELHRVQETASSTRDYPALVEALRGSGGEGEASAQLESLLRNSGRAGGR